MADQPVPLKIDPVFKTLIPPLNRNEYIRLEASLIEEGCRDPIVTWEGTIIDGHNRYEICTRLNIPIKTRAMEFECREEVVAWMCANQLARRNLTEETKKYLIGLQYEQTKLANYKKNAGGRNQYSLEIIKTARSPRGYRTADNIAEEHHISHGSVEKYAAYSRALEELKTKRPQLVPKILAGQIRISHEGVLELSKMNPAELRSVDRQLGRGKEPFVTLKRTRKILQIPKKEDLHIIQPEIKNMPSFDPDAEVTELSLTVPSWTSSIKRVRHSAHLNNISEAAKQKLIGILTEHQKAVSDILSAIEE